MLCLRKFPLAKRIMDKMGRVSRFSVGKFLSYSAEKFRKGTFLCCVSENFRYRKRLWIREGRRIKIFRRKKFVSHSRKLSQLNPFELCFIKFPVAKKIMD